MFCPNCGKQIPDDSVFCEYCGSSIAQYSVDGAAQGNAGNGNIPAGWKSTGGIEPLPKEGKTNPVLIVAFILVVALLIGGVVLVRSGTIKSGKFEESPAATNDIGWTNGDKESKENSAAATDSKDGEPEEKSEDAADGKADAGTSNGKDDEAERAQDGPADEAKADTEVAASEVAAEGGDVLDSDYNPATYAISGGMWEVLQSGETIYTLKDGSSVHNAWIEDGGKYKYVDFSGCLMKNNYTADGFWVGEDGCWDTAVKQRKDDVEPLSGESYGTDPVLVIDIMNFSDNATYAKATRTYSFGYSEEYNVMPLGNSTYLLEGENDFNSGLLLSVSEDRKTLTLSGLGITEEYKVK